MLLRIMRNDDVKVNFFLSIRHFCDRNRLKAQKRVVDLPMFIFVGDNQGYLECLLKSLQGHKVTRKKPSVTMQKIKKIVQLQL